MYNEFKEFEDLMNDIKLDWNQSNLSEEIRIDDAIACASRAAWLMDKLILEGTLKKTAIILQIRKRFYDLAKCEEIDDIGMFLSCIEFDKEMYEIRRRA